MPSTFPPADVPPLERLHCGCGYLLRGLRPEGRCPECGKPIVETIDDVLRLAEMRRRRWDWRGLIALLGAFAGTMWFAVGEGRAVTVEE